MTMVKMEMDPVHGPQLGQHVLETFIQGKMRGTRLYSLVGDEPDAYQHPISNRHETAVYLEREIAFEFGQAKLKGVRVCNGVGVGLVLARTSATFHHCHKFPAGRTLHTGKYRVNE